MSDKTIIQGAGGGKGGGGGRAAVEAPDSLRSQQIAQVVDLVSEGPIQGLSDGLRSIFINETPLMNSDGTMNFKNVAVEWRQGNQIQDPFTGLTGAEAETPVSVEVKNGVPVVRTITNAEVDMVRVTISIPQLTEQNPQNGDINGSAVAFHIDIQNNGSGYQTRLTDAIQGKTTSKYQRSYLIVFNGPGPWDIRVVRDTSDSTTSAIQNSMFWESYTSIVRANLTYPNSAMVYTRIESSQFNSIPTRGYGLKGLIVRVPTNYDPINRTYTGAWDGTFKLAWTDNPAWCFYDLLTNERYGLGQYVDQNSIDKWLLYSIAQYCDQQVPNGYGGYEARFRCNLYLQSREEAFQVVQNFASIFRAITYWGSGTIMTVQDRPADAVALYSPANVIDGSFSYSGSSIKNRHTVALVAWADPKDMYRQKIEYVQDEELVKQHGIIESTITAFGCTSRGQAHRYGKWMLAVERYCTETVTFKAGLDSVGLYPGAIIKTTDPIRAGKRMGGRITANTTNTVTLDNPITLEAGRTYTISIISSNTVPQNHTIVSGAGTHQILTLGSVLSAPIVYGAVFVIAADNLVPETWRVVGVKEASPTTVEVMAVSYYEGLYDYVELGNQFVLPPVSNIRVRPARPQNLSLITYAYVVGGSMAGLNGTLSWTGSSPRYMVRWRRTNGAWQERIVYDVATEIVGLTSEPHIFQVVAIGANGLESDAAVLTITPSLDAVNLPDVTGLSLDGPFTIDQAKFKWDPVSGAERYEVEIYSLGVMRRFLDIGNSLTYTYSAADMRVDGGPWRVVKIRVRARGRFGSRSNWVELEVGNSQIGPLQGIDVQYGIKSIFFQCERPTDPDFVGIIIWLGESPDFSPTSERIVYDGPDLFKAIYQLGDGTTLEGGKTYYLRAAGYDNFGKDSLIISNSFLIIPAKNAPDEGAIQRDMIADGAIDIAKFADGLEPVMMVETLELPPTIFKGAWNVFNMSNHKLYRWNGEQYEHRIGAGDLAADSVTAGTIAAGAINAREIAAGAITSEKLYIAARGAALNVDPGMMDQTAWEGSNYSHVRLVDGSVGLWAVRSDNGRPGGLNGKEYIPIDPRKNYRLRVVARRSPTANGSLFLGVELRDANGTLIPSQDGQYWYYGSKGGAPSLTWNQITESMNVTAFNSQTNSGPFPSTARTMRPMAFLNFNGTDGYHEIQDFRIEEILPGTLIQDGAISTSKITAGAVTADKILANSITGDRLVANTITGDKIAAQTIDANHIKAGAITVGSIAAGSITADKIDSRNLTLKDAAGNVILGSGVNLNVSMVTGLGNFAYLNSITAQNISTYIASAAIQEAHIANLSVTNAKIGDLVVGTTKITPNAVTMNMGGVGNNFVDIFVPVSGGNVAVFGKVKMANPDGGGGEEMMFMELRANDFVISQESGGNFYQPAISISSFTLHQPPAGQTIKYTCVATWSVNSLGPATCQILVIEFKR